jgi:hypothetical protein
MEEISFPVPCQWPEKMVENGINDRKIGHFPPSKCRKNQRQNPGGGVL